MISIFTVPKAFSGHFAVIQRNAIRSWLQLSPRPEIILFGDDDGVEEASRELNVKHFGTIRRNEYGTPIISDVFLKADKVASSDLLCYTNTDIILLSDFAKAIQSMQSLKRFLAVGQRWDLNIPESLKFQQGWEEKLRKEIRDSGELHDISAMDYFIFPKGFWEKIPAFAIGRTVWDNWLIYSARIRRSMVIDATQGITAVHQNHEYSHLPKYEGDAWTGPEAKENLRLAGGYSQMLVIIDATHILTSTGRLRRALDWKHLVRSLCVMDVLHPEKLWLRKLFQFFRNLQYYALQIRKKLRSQVA